MMNEQVTLEIDDDKRLETAIRSFFNYIFSDTFKIQLNIKKNKNRGINNLKFENKLVLRKNSIYKTQTSSNYKFEKEIIYKFYNQTNSISALVNLRDKIREIFLLSQYIRDFYLNNGKNRILSRKRVIHHLENEYFIKIKKEYFNFLNLIINHYFKVRIKWLHDYIAERIEYMWRKHPHN